MKGTVATFTAVLVSITSTSKASPVYVQARALSPSAICMSQKYPNYHTTTSIDKQHVAYCFDKTKVKGKRDEAGAASNNHDPLELDELVYEPTEEGALQARSIVDKLIVLGKDLFLAANPTYSALDVVAKAAEVCEKLKANIVVTDVARDRGVTYVLDHFNSGHDKQGHQLKDNWWVHASYFLRYVLPAKATVNEIQALSASIYNLCNDGNEGILTKGNICTQLAKYYRLSKAKHYTGDSAKTRNLNLY
jgi:hypothetical protein